MCQIGFESCTLTHFQKVGFGVSLTRVEEVGRLLQDDCRTKNLSLQMQDENSKFTCEFPKLCSTKIDVLLDERGGSYPYFKGGWNQWVYEKTEYTSNH